MSGEKGPVDIEAMARSLHGEILGDRLGEAAADLEELAKRLRSLQHDVPHLGGTSRADNAAQIAEQALRLITTTLGNLPLATISKAGSDYDRALRLAADEAGDAAS